jgi:hypothetical protein
MSGIHVLPQRRAFCICIFALRGRYRRKKKHGEESARRQLYGDK